MQKIGFPQKNMFLEINHEQLISIMDINLWFHQALMSFCVCQMNMLHIFLTFMTQFFHQKKCRQLVLSFILKETLSWMKKIIEIWWQKYDKALNSRKNLEMRNCTICMGGIQSCINKVISNRFLGMVLAFNSEILFRKCRYEYLNKFKMLIFFCFNMLIDMSAIPSQNVCRNCKICLIFSYLSRNKSFFLDKRNNFREWKIVQKCLIIIITKNISKFLDKYK